VNNHDKHKSKDKRKKSKKKDNGHGKKTRSREKMKRSSDIESDSEDTSSSSSDEDEEDDKKKKKNNLVKYFNGLCVTGLSLKDDFCGITSSSSFGITFLESHLNFFFCPLLIGSSNRNLDSCRGSISISFPRARRNLRPF
jgi:hypothetical protein